MCLENLNLTAVRRKILIHFAQREEKKNEKIYGQHRGRKCEKISSKEA